jgi:hypothetical protein
MMDADAMDDTHTHTTEDDLTDAGTMDVDATASAIIVNRFPFSHPGAPIIGPHQTSASNGSSSMVTGDSLWSPFFSQLDWEVARWAKTCGTTSSAVVDLLAIPGVGTPLPPSVYCGSNLQIKVVGKLGLSYRTTKQLNDIIDKKLPGLPPFECQKLKIRHVSIIGTRCNISDHSMEILSWCNTWCLHQNSTTPIMSGHATF